MASLSNPIPPPPEPQSDGGFSLDYELTPTFLLAILVIAIIIFFTGLLHLLHRLCFNTQLRTEHEDSGVDGGASAFQGQLRQLFHLHDAGVDQTFIDALPVFLYKSIIGTKSDAFDCSVCLCEFHPDDKLRLLTNCSHAFHMECIDTWLLTHSTCPLCRGSLISDFEFSSPIVVGVLESAGNSSREIGENQTGSDSDPPAAVPIKLGKFKSMERNGEGSSDNGVVDSRRCFSMGSFGYVMDQNSSLQIPIRTPAMRKKRNTQLTAGIRAVKSEREFDFVDSNRKVDGGGDGDGGRATELGRRAFSFHFPANWKRPRWENGMDEENQRRNSFENVENEGSFVRRALQRLMGKNKNTTRIVHSSFTPNHDHCAS